MLRRIHCLFLSLILATPVVCQSAGHEEPEKLRGGQTVMLSAETLRDKIRGGLLGQILGVMNGLPYEFDYNEEPGDIQGYVPDLSKGAYTDDDTDLEWVYVVEMQRQNCVLLPSREIARLWRERINRSIWCSNQYARQLMDIGIEPPLTGNVLLNPWAEFNISGQFICETFGLLAPAMPQTASRIGLNYTRVTIDGEPAQTTQLFDTMIACAFVEDDIGKLLDAGLSAVDDHSDIRRIVLDVRGWHAESPEDWRPTRERIRVSYTRYGGALRDINGYELNTACTIAALLYGDGDFPRTLETAFNLGWDCDNNAATAGTIVGVIKGYRWMLSQGWPIVDRYENRTRDNMPSDETITSFADRLTDLAEKVIVEQGGDRLWNEGRIVLQIPAEEPANVAPFRNNAELAAIMRNEMDAEIRQGIESSSVQLRARAAYLAICLDMVGCLKDEQPQRWQSALEALHEYDQIAQVLYYHSSVPAAEALRQKARKAGLEQPAESRELW